MAVATKRMTLAEWAGCTIGANVTHCDNGNVLVADSNLTNHSALYTLTDYYVSEDQWGYTTLKRRGRKHATIGTTGLESGWPDQPA